MRPDGRIACPYHGWNYDCLGQREIAYDGRFIPTVADTPFEWKGMRLGKYDRPLVHNHKLLERICWGSSYEAAFAQGAAGREPTRPSNGALEGGGLAAPRGGL